MPRPQYLVIPRDGGWMLRSGPVPLRLFPTKQGALSAAVRLASCSRPSELVIRGRDGAIQDRRLYEAAPAAN